MINTVTACASVPPKFSGKYPDPPLVTVIAPIPLGPTNGAPTAVAPAMMSGGNTDLCSTGTSGSVQTQIFGVSGGGTTRDMNCERLKLSKTLYDMGMKVAAVATMCQDRRVFDAMLAAGTPCPYEGKIGLQAKAEWEANVDKIPKYDEAKLDDTYKKVGIGALLGALVFKLF